MRTSGRSGSETMMFIAPAAIFAGFFVWLFGDPHSLVVLIDRTLLHAGYTAIGWVAALFS